ncbi:MAG: hypothetical protein ACREOM_08455, partial [Candidatus Dormibacteraceae bacterium]
MAAERPDWEWYRHASELVAEGRLDEAERVAASALEAGHLWRVSLLPAPALEALRGREVFESVAAEGRRRVAARNLKPSVLIVKPARMANLTPLLLAFHGSAGNAAAELERWRQAAELGYIVASGQSSQPATADGFCWDPPRERVWQDLNAIIGALPLHARVVLAGFSQGAWVALNAALSGDVVVAGGVIMVAPFGGPTANLERAWRRLRIAVLVGEEDVYRADVGRLAHDLEARGHHLWLEIIP